MNCSLWTSELERDLDKDFLLDGIIHGFQLLPANAQLAPAEMNNYSSAVNPQSKIKVEETILDEIKAGNYVICNQKPVIVSALGAVPKPDSPDLRLIHDCSMPLGHGVNSYVDIDKQKFQTLDDAMQMIKHGYYLAKVDLRHAYCSVPVHPANYPALGLKWRFSGHSHFTYFVDTRLPFGGRSAPGIFHRITQSVRRMMSRRGFTVVVYLDDFLVVAPTLAECKLAYDTLCTLLMDLGFELSSNKLVPPCQQLTFLGILIDTVSLRLSLPSNKLDLLQSEIKAFMLKKRASKRQLQQLAGRLNWACKVVFGGRTFLRRVLNLMNTLATPASQCRLTLEFYRDMAWWNEFLETFNGECDFTDSRPVTDIYTDACEFGIGAVFHNDWFYSNLLVDLPEFAFLHINFKETLCIIIALLHWAPSLRNKKIIIHSDNTTAVSIINKGTAKNSLIMAYIRQLFWCSATYNFRIQAIHIPGHCNVLADHASRLEDSAHFSAFLQFLHGGTVPASSV